jgi:predicted AlkP superfamily pyrophosphatase or phosphodiesterase
MFTPHISSTSGLRMGVAVLGAVLVVSCGRPIYITSPSNASSHVERPATRVTDNVVVVSVDGLRPDAIATFKAPTLQRLIAEGSYTLSAKTILPSKTLPSHTSMLTGEPPERHGVYWNNTLEDEPGTIEIPTIFGIAREHGYSTAAFFSKSKFSHLQQPGSLDYSQAPGGWFGRWSGSQTMKDVERHLLTAKPNLLFVHITDPDSAGHSSGWMSAEYGKGVLEADAAVARLIKASDTAFGAGEYTLILTADHGGHGYDHGSDDPRDVTIPWIAWGEGVRPGQLLESSVQTMDTASTALLLLGLERPSRWAGSPVMGALAGAVATQ